MKRITLLGLFLASLQLFAVNAKDDFVYDLSLATQGISVSQFNTGVNYSIGRGIQKDIEKQMQKKEKTDVYVWYCSFFTKMV